MIRFKTGDFVFEVPEPVGRSSRELFRLAASIIADCKYAPPMPGMSRSELSENEHTFTMRLASHLKADLALESTFKNATVNDLPFTMAFVDALPARFQSMPFEALSEAWGRLGFLGNTTRKLIEMADDLKAQANRPSEEESTDSPTPSPKPSQP